MSALYMLLCYVYIFHISAPWLLIHPAAPYKFFPRCCAMSSFPTLFASRCDISSLFTLMSSFSMLLRYVYIFHAAVSCLLFPNHYALSTFPCCCAMSTLFTLLRHVYFFLLQNIYLFHTAAVCLFELLCYVFFFTLLCYVYFVYVAALCLLFHRCCAMSTFSTTMRNVYFFHATALCLLFPRCCSMSHFSTLLRHVYFSTLLCNVYFSTLMCFVFFFHTSAQCLLFPRS